MVNDWSGSWLNPPVAVLEDNHHLLVTAANESDFWRTTSYGFIHDNGHALLNDFPNNSSLEVSWILDYKDEFDQAGLMIWAGPEHWIKAGVEFSDGNPQLGAVVTNLVSDWSVAPVPTWMNQEVHLRFSRSGDALTIRAKCDGHWQLVRLVPLEESRTWSAGLFLASPSREGLTVRFTKITRGESDPSLH